MASIRLAWPNMDLNPEPLARYLTHYFRFVTHGNNLTRQRFFLVYLEGTLPSRYTFGASMKDGTEKSWIIHIKWLLPLKRILAIHLWKKGSTCSLHLVMNSNRVVRVCSRNSGPIPLEFRSRARRWPCMGPRSHNSSILNPYPTQSTLIPSHTWCQLLHSSNNMNPLLVNRARSKAHFTLGVKANV
jgi:hypothetical protein